MAVAYPEGECFFQRSKLDNAYYHANNPKDFYSYMMIEYVWNAEADHGSRNCKTSSGGHRHPRSGYQIVRGSNWGTDYGNWTHLPFGFGPDCDKISRRTDHELCTTGNVFKDRENGGSYQPWFMMVPMPTREERWMWIDMLTYIRAIYLPVAWSVSKDHADLCSYVQVNFALGRTVKVWHGENLFKDVKTDQVLGLMKDEYRTLALNVTGLIELLTLPRQLRKDNCYNLKLIKLQDPNSLQPTQKAEKTQRNYADISWLTIASGNFGLDLTWSPPQKSTWQENFIKNTINVALGFVPGAGPFLQIMFSVGWTLVSEEDPDAAFKILKDLCPGVDLTEKIMQELIASAKETRAFLPDGWVELGLSAKKGVVEVKVGERAIEAMDKMLPMLMQKEVLDATGNSPDKEPGKISEEGGETLVDNPVGEFMDATQVLIGVA